MVQAATQRLGNINSEPDRDTEYMSLEETAKLLKEREDEETRQEEAAILKDFEEIVAAPVAPEAPALEAAEAGEEVAEAMDE
ncbi:hypothetical protein CYMTET_44575 [Cymbomonas tetramitiformis]|uniref:Uncharacterized protein n=1 Tax=Cymbomonas tetramitiformis TaxID=36881 RepID=A0AAE0EZF5_9CHLO|nr:hypothetical protein CYMTET_44575 [Cymbomonas tetramitiformis]